MTPEDVVRELRNVAEKHKDTHIMTFGTNVSAMATDTANVIERLLSSFTWVSVSERLPERPLYDWVLVRTRLVPEGFYGGPHVAELRNGVWYCRESDKPMEEELSIKVISWFDMQIIRE
jgi:hypothetical protein